MDHKKYLKSLPKKIMAAGAFIFDKNGKMLLVKPSYKKHWSIPGGVIELGESPRVSCEREIEEETGLKLKIKQFLAIDYFSEEDRFIFYFYGGVLTKNQINSIVIPSDEIVQFGFFNKSEAQNMVSKRFLKRLHLYLKAIKLNKPIYLD